MKQKGITLVALVITIVILLILAGVVIGTVTGADGIFSKAKQSKDSYEITRLKEDISVTMTAKDSTKSIK